MFVLSTWTGLWAVLVLQAVNGVQGETLTPPYFNLAEGKKITASATCGVDTDGPELYCKLIGANDENDLNAHNVLKGHVRALLYIFFTTISDFGRSKRICN